MILCYGNYSLSFTLTASGANDAAFLTSPAVMNDGRIGLVCSIKWISGSQSTSDYVSLIVDGTSPLDAIPIIGACGLANVIGLPAGLRCTVGSVDQVLVENALGELNAWWLPNFTGFPFEIRIWNDNGTTHPIAANQVFGIGEVMAGRAIQLPTLVAPSGGNQPTKGLNDPTAFTRVDTGSLYQVMRKPWDTYTFGVGMFTNAQAYGGAASNIPNGNGGVININRLRGILSTSAVCAVCDYPSAGFGAGAVSNGIRYDQDFMQNSWIVAKPSDPGAIIMDQPPYSSWYPTFAKTA